MMCPSHILVTFWQPLVTKGGKKINIDRTNSNVTMCWGRGGAAISHMFEENNPRGLKKFHNFFSFIKSTIKTDHIKQK